jgi:hypothetical protein
MPCNCADTIDDKLKDRNTRLTRAIVFSQRHPDNPNLMIVTEQIESGRGKKKACGMFASFCPFCGTRYEPEEQP